LKVDLKFDPLRSNPAFRSRYGGWDFHRDRAIEAYRATLDLGPEKALRQVLLGMAYQEKPMHAEAIAVHETAKKIENGNQVIIQPQMSEGFGKRSQRTGLQFRFEDLCLLDS
jgi:hypothetical protein